MISVHGVFNINLLHLIHCSVLSKMHLEYGTTLTDQCCCEVQWHVATSDKCPPVDFQIDDLNSTKSASYTSFMYQMNTQKVNKTE